MSLANLFDIQAPAEYLRALIALMTEYEAFQDETIKPKVRSPSSDRVLPLAPNGLCQPCLPYRDGGVMSDTLSVSHRPMIR